MPHVYFICQSFTFLYIKQSHRICALRMVPKLYRVNKLLFGFYCVPVFSFVYNVELIFNVCIKNCRSGL